MKKTIVFDARKIYDYGVGTHIQGLLHALLTKAERSFNWIIILPERFHVQTTFLAEFSHINPVKTHVKPFSIKSLTTFSRFIHAYEPHVYHNPYFPLPLFIQSHSIVTIHDTILLDRKLQKNRPWVVPVAKWLMKSSFRKAQRIFTVSQASADELIRLFPGVSGRIRVIPNALPRSFLSPLPDNICHQFLKTHHLNSRSYYLFVGNPKPHKNLNLLLEAWTHSFPEHRQVLVLVGPPPDTHASLRKRIPGHLQESCLILYGLSKDELRCLYTHARATVCPSLKEGFCLPALESLALGTPVLYSDIEPLRSLVGKGGWAFPPERGDILVTYLKRLVTHEYEILRREASAMKTKIFETYSWEKSADLVLKEYEVLFSSTTT